MSQSRADAGETILAYVDMLAEAEPGVDIRPFDVTVNGQRFVVAVVRESAWQEVEQILAESGCTRIPRRFQ